MPAGRGAFTLDLDYFDFHTTAKRSYSDEMVRLLGTPRAPHEPLDPTTPEGARFANIAASVQRVLEDTLVEITKSLHEETGLAGLRLHPDAPRPLDVDIHDIPARPGEPAHEHLDLRYLVLADADAEHSRDLNETDDLRWFAWDELDGLGLDHGLRRALVKARRILDGEL